MENKKLVMIPGPTPVVKSIQDQMGREIQAFGDPRFVKDYKTLIDDLGEMFGCDGKTFIIAGTGTLAMEMAIANSTKAGDDILLVSHGYFGDRFKDICKRKGLNLDVLQSEWGKTVPVCEIEAKLKSHKYAVLLVTHVDTATGACAPVQEIGEMMKNFPETVYILDGVCASGAEYENLREMNIDILFTGTQKAFGVCPGLLMLWASPKAIQRRKDLGMIPEYYIDFENWIPIMDDPTKYFATPAVNLVWALAESVRLIKEEGYKNRVARHKKNALAMQKAFEAIGLMPLADPECRASTLSNLLYPEGIDDVQFRGFLAEEGIIVAGGLGAYKGKMFRVGHMGHTDINDMVMALSAIERALARCGKDVLGKGIAVYMAEMMK